MSAPSVTRSKLWWCAVLMIIILICVFVYRSGIALYHNHQLREDFTAALNTSPYQLGVPMEEMDLTAYAPYLPKVFTALGYQLTHRIESPVTLKYYSDNPSKSEAAALEIVKGTMIVAIPEWSRGSPFYEAGYGYTSYPTYEEGWRYVRPFILADDSDQESNERYYYVHMNSLEAVLDKVIEVNQPLQTEIRQQGWSISKGKHIFARFIDNALHQHGAYLSPDLFHKVIDRWNVMLLGAIGVVLIALLLSRSARPHRRSTL